jgi:uncharacterized protein YdiU (UPF0061 family)
VLEPALNQFWPAFRTEMAAAVLDRLGLLPLGANEDSELVTALFSFLMASRAPFEQVFFDWYGGVLSRARAAASPVAGSYAGEAFAAFETQLLAHAARPGLRLDHPYFGRERPRTMLIEEMEALWTPIADGDDWAPFNVALGEIATMREAYGADQPASG